MKPIELIVMARHHDAFASSPLQPMILIITEDSVAHPFVGFDMSPECVREALSVIDSIGEIETDPKLVILSANVEYYELHEDGVSGPIDTLVSYGVNEEGYADRMVTRYNEDAEDWEDYESGYHADHGAFIEVLTRYMVDPDY